MNISQAGFTDAEKLIKNLTPHDHVLVLETEVKPVEFCGSSAQGRSSNFSEKVGNSRNNDGSKMAEAGTWKRP